MTREELYQELKKYLKLDGQTSAKIPIRIKPTPIANPKIVVIISHTIMILL